MNRVLTVHDLGRVEYEDGLSLQAVFARGRAEGRVGDTLLLLEHPPVLTLGRAAKREHILASPERMQEMGVALHETDRGGDVTYHGPGQVVGYPIIDLAPDRQDVRRYVSDLEEMMIRSLADFGLEAHRIPGWVGVWLGEREQGTARKIGAIGVHISRWITTHGFALNVNTRLDHFSLIVPCGIQEGGVTSMKKELAAEQPIAEVEARLSTQLAGRLEADLAVAEPPMRTVSVTVLRPGEKGPELLLLKRRPERGGFWQQVTGRQEEGESPADAAVRELEEETGIVAAPEPLDYVHSFAWARAETPCVCRETAFVVRVERGQRIRISAEHEAQRWLPAAEAEREVPYAGLKEAIRRSIGLPLPPTPSSRSAGEGA